MNRKLMRTIIDDAAKEGWTLSSTGRGYQIQRLDIPEDHLSFDPEVGTRFETDDAAIAHVIARSWQGSQLHKVVLSIIEIQDPEEFARLGIEDLRIASAIQMRRDREAYETSSAAVAEHMKVDEGFADAASDHLQNLFAEIDQRRLENRAGHARYKTPNITQYEAYHENQVTRMAFINALHETGDPSAAADHTRQRMLLTATPQEFLAPLLEEMTIDAEAAVEEPSEPGM